MENPSLSGDLFRAVVEASPCALILIDSKGCMTPLNSMVESLFGYTAAELSGETVELLVPERFRGQHHRDREAYGRGPSRRSMGAGRDLWGRRKDGVDFPIEIALTPVKGLGEEFVIATVVDITERRRREGMREHLIHDMNHEVRQPLSSLFGAMREIQSLAKERFKDSELALVELTLRAVQRLVNITDSLTDFLDSETDKLPISPAPIALKPIIDDLVALYSRKTPGLKADIPADLPYVLADPLRVGQICGNLISNACKFTPPGGDITVRAGVWEKESGFLRVAVGDDGPGIPAAEIPNLFTRYYQIKENVKGRGGMGIGLFLAREFAVRQGGTIRVESPGKGSTFCFTLPITDRKPQAAEPATD